MNISNPHLTNAPNTCKISPRARAHITRGDVAQLGEHHVRNVGVVGSNPIISTTEFERPGHSRSFFVRGRGAVKPSSQTCLRQRGSFSDWCRANDKTDLIAEWLTDRNSGIGPDMVTPGTNQNAYWRCSICGHEWPASPKTRKNGHGCPECKKRLLSEKRLGYALRSSQSLEEWCLVNSRQDMLNE